MEDPDATDMSLNESVEDNYSFLDTELEALQSIYINELDVNTDENCTTVSIDLHPATADKLDEQYVRMTLQFILKEEYPEVIPEIKIRNPRGLSDEKLTSIVKDLLAIAETKRGNSMLFEMIDAAKEHLTVGNRPSGECAICLYGFSDKDVFTKTECYHYFHSHCLARYAKNFIENSKDNETDAKNKCISNELLCPMCRVAIEFNGTDEDYPPPEESDESDFALTEEIRKLQRKMADLYQKQVENGGIIDVEAEKNKYLLEISNVPTQITTRVITEEKHEQKLVTDGDSCATDSQVEPSDELDSPSRERRERVRDHHERSDYKGKSRNFNRPGEKGNYRPDHRYNRHSYDNYQRSYNKNRYGRRNSTGSNRQFNDSDLPQDTDSTEPCDHRESDNLDHTEDVHDDLSETSEQTSVDSKGKNNANFSPRHNRGRRGWSHYGYHNNRRFNKSSYHERSSSEISQKYGNNHGGDEQSSANSEERVEKDVRNVRTYNNEHKPNYRSDSFRHDENYRQRYPDRNSQRGYKGAYGRRDNYSYNNYPRGSKYGDSRDRDQYHGERGRNFRVKRTYREEKYQGNVDNVSEGYNKQGARNYTKNRPGSYADRSYTESSNNESESVELSSQSSDYKKLSEEKECNSKRHLDSSERENKSSQKNLTSGENCAGKLTNSVPVSEGSGPSSFPKVSNDILPISSRIVNPPPGFANPLKKVIYGLQGANPPPGFNKS